MATRARKSKSALPTVTKSPANPAKKPAPQYEAQQLSHYDSAGRARMVDVSSKATTLRTAEASARLEMSPKVLKALATNPKGDPFEVARFAGIQAAKRTSELVPMCHSIPLRYVDISHTVCEDGVKLHSRVTATNATGVEMEALTAVAVAALTVYDMCKALDKGTVIRNIQLEKKSGGKSGEYRRS